MILPDILASIEEEYKTFNITISDIDLLFVIEYIQERLLSVIKESTLEEMFSQTYLVC